MAFFRRLLRLPLGLAALFALLLLSGHASWGAESALPRNRSIAVLVRASSAQHGSTAESILIRSLLDGGFRAVDQKQLERIRQAKAAALALDGNVEAILELSRSFGFDVLLSGRAAVPAPARNEFGLFTATADLALTACLGSSGRQIYADTTTAKEVGYTAAEAGQKALEAATRLAAKRMIDGASAEAAPAEAKGFTVEVSGLRSFVEAHAVVESCTRAGATGARLSRFSGGVAVVAVTFPGSAQDLAQALLKTESALSLEGIDGERIRLKRS